MGEIEENQSFLNKPMSNRWKGIVSTILTALLSYPIIAFELELLDENNNFDYFILILHYTPIIIAVFGLVWVIFLYSAVSVLKEGKWFNFPSMLISGAAAMISIFY